MNKRDCVLYVDIKMSEEDILDLIHKKYGGKRSYYYVDCNWAIFDIESNDAYSWIKKRRKDDGFLYFKYMIAVESKIEESFNLFVSNLRDFIAILKQKGGQVVPACDFEDELNITGR